MDIFSRFKNIVSESSHPVVLEFGTCEGDQTNQMVSHLRAFKKPFIYHAFEPQIGLNPDFFARNKKHIDAGSLKFYNYAIGNMDGECDFWISSGSEIKDGKQVNSYHGSSSIKEPKIVLREYPQMKFDSSKTPVIKLDTHYKNSELNGKTIDFIWADVQGAEKDMIKGGIDTFTNHVKYLYTEYIDGYSYADKINIPEILNLLPGFEVVQDYGGDVLLRNTKFKL